MYSHIIHVVIMCLCCVLMGTGTQCDGSAGLPPEG